jgi:hypothetical protein
MNIYTRDEERTIRVQRLVDDWTKSKLLSKEQRERIVPGLQVDLRRTNRYLRGTLFLFGYLIITSVAGLLVATLNPRDDTAKMLALIAGMVGFAIARLLATRYRLYHFGIEEAAAIAGLTSMIIAIAMLLSSTFSVFWGLVMAALGAFILFATFGYLYAAVGAVLFAAFAPFGVQSLADTTHRLIAMVLMLTTFFIARERREDYDWDYPGDSYAVIETTAWVMLYFMANLKATDWFSSTDDVRAFYWATYVIIWMIPAAGLFFAVRDRHRAMLDANILLAIGTLMSNKPYLGKDPQPYDPILFGVLLIAIAIGVRRWLAGGPNGSRSGFVAHRLLASEKAQLAMVGSATILAPGAPAHTHTDAGPAIGGGGRSGGAGASGSF